VFGIVYVRGCERRWWLLGGTRNMYEISGSHGSEYEKDFFISGYTSP
jgi:hypothetical protein